MQSPVTLAQPIGSKVPNPDMFKGVPLTGVTLEAALAMRCDLTGAGYAVYWAPVGGAFKPIKEHTTAARKKELSVLGLSKSFSEETSMSLPLDASGENAVAKVRRTGEPIWIPSAVNSQWLRKDLSIRYGIQSVAFEPYEGGVIEYGTGVGPATAEWSERPTAPIMPKAEMRKAFEELGALYVMFWAKDADDMIRPHASFNSPKAVALQSKIRSDGDSFLARSKKLAFAVSGTGPVSTAFRENAEVTIAVAGDNAGKGEKEVSVTINGFTSTRQFEGCSGLLKRSNDISEFGIRSIHLVPVEGGVFEYGVQAEATLKDVTLDATIELECEAAGASYAIYWKESRDKMSVVAGSFNTPEFTAESKSLGFSLTYTQASEAFASPLDKTNDSPVAEVLRTRKPIFIKDVCSYKGPFKRRDIAKSYNVKSVVFQPVLGGVIEMGKSDAAPTFGSCDWVSAESALANKIPNAALADAFAKQGATYAIFWKRNFDTGMYELAANYETLTNSLNARALESDESFAKDSEGTSIAIMGDGPVASAGKAGVEIVIPNLDSYPNFKRADIAKQWGVGKMTLLPCETGVLEYGTVTKDKRTTTVGAEFQEASRPYRRDVFGHDDWIKHRSTERFQRSLATILQSGVLRARYSEVATVMAIASFLSLYNGLTGGFVDLAGAKQEALLPFLPVLTLPLSLFSLTAPSLGLLLVFRTNACYGRWDDSRKVWGSIINKCRSLVRQANTFFDDEYPGYGNFRDGRRRVAAETSAFTRCLRCFLRGEVDAPKLESELKDLGFTPDEIAGYMGATNRQVYALAQIGSTIRNANIDSLERSRMDTTLSALTDDIGACERIFKTPIPTVYTGHTSRFTGTWLALLPLAIYGIDPSWNHLASIPAVGAITFFLLGIEELGLQIEEPFSLLPMEAYCDGSIGAPLDAMVLNEDKTRIAAKARGMPTSKAANDDAEMADIQTASSKLKLAEDVDPDLMAELEEAMIEMLANADDTKDGPAPFSQAWVEQVKRS